MRFLSVPSVLAALVAVGVYFLYDPPRQCFHDLSSSGACLFSDSYFAARCRFREAAAARNASPSTCVGFSCVSPATIEGERQPRT